MPANAIPNLFIEGNNAVNIIKKMAPRHDMPHKVERHDISFWPWSLYIKICYKYVYNHLVSCYDVHSSMILVYVLLMIWAGVGRSTRPYSVHRTSDEYIIQVHKSLGRLKARISDENTLHVYDQSALNRFSRKWTLPDDIDISKATQYTENLWFIVRLPRIRPPALVGGEYERGTRIDLPSEHICVTFDGSHPKCGKEQQCAVGEHIDSFTVDEDEITVRMVYCKMKARKVQEAIFYSYDSDVEIEDLPSDPHQDSLEGSGWYDIRLGKIRPY